MSVLPEAVTAGLVVRLDTSVLRERGDSLTNAVHGPEGDRAVTGEHDFLIVGLDLPRTLCTAVPLFTKTAVGSQPLDTTLQTGGSSDWRQSTVYFSRWQHWRIPTTSVVAAMVDDASTATTRRRFAALDRSALDDIKNWEGRNRAEYRRA